MEVSIRVSEIKTGTKEDAGFGDFYFELSTEKKGYGKEGYSMDIDQSVSVEAEEATGAGISNSGTMSTPMTLQSLINVRNSSFV